MVSKFFSTSLLLATALITGALSGKTPEYSWVFSGGGAKYDKVRGVATDQEGNVYLTGDATDDGNFGDLIRQSHGASDAFLLKLSPSGKPLWIQTLGGSLVDRGYGVATDKDGNVYVTGHHQSIDGKAAHTGMSNKGDYDLFLAKYNPEGELLWLKSEGSSGYDYSHGVNVDAAGNVVISGSIFSDIKYGDTELKGHRMIFCAKYKPNGDLIWVKGTEDKLSGSAHGISTDAANNIYLGGLIHGTGKFGNISLSSKTPHAMVAKLTSEGEVLWVNSEPASGNACYHEITADSQGRIWTAGMFKGELTLGSEKHASTSLKDYDGVLAHYDTHGKLQWSKQIHSAATDYGLGVTTDDQGTAYFSGSYGSPATFCGQSLETQGSSDILIAAFNPKGELLAQYLAGGSKADSAYTVTYKDSSIYFAGAIAGGVKFGDKEVKETQSADLYVTKLKVK